MCVFLQFFVSHFFQTRSLGVISYHIRHSMSGNERKWVFRVSDQVRHKPVCAVTEDGLKLEISDLRRLVLSVP